MFRHHELGVPAYGFNPVCKVLDIRHSGGESDDPNALRQVDDHFLPNRSSEPVSEIMDLVENHIAQGVERCRMLVEHIAQHFGGHHHDVGLGIYRGVTGEQPHLIRTVHVD